MDWKYLLTSFEGRINRKPFWLGAIAFGIVVSILTTIVESLFGIKTDSSMPGYTQDFTQFGWILISIIGLVSLWVGLALQVKRWHDRDKSGWWVLIGLIPVIGNIWALVETGFLRGTDGTNSYGPDPLA